MNKKAIKYIEKLQLQPHPEGGYYKEIYRAGEIIVAKHLPKRYKSSRPFSTSIYFLLEGRQVSTFHRLKSDEQWHFYDGAEVILYIIDMNGSFNKIRLGKNYEKGESYQTVIPKYSWFGAELKDKASFALLGCNVSPGFDFKDFEPGNREILLRKYPEYEKVIIRLTCK